MGWTPQPRYSAKTGRWKFNFRGKQYARKERLDIFKLYAEVIGDAASTRSRKTIANLIEEWLQLHPSEWGTYCLGDWLDIEGATPVNKLHRSCLARYRDHLKGVGNSPQTIKHKVRHAYRVLQWSEEAGHIEAIPRMPKLDRVVRIARDIPLPRLYEILDAMDTAYSVRAYRLTRFILATGCRPGEARLARWEDIDLSRRTWRVRRTKTKIDRSAPLLDDALPPLREAKEADGRAGFVFLTRDGQPYTRQGFHKICHRYGFTPYALRHTCAQYLSDIGTDVHIISKLLGHRNLSTVQHYARVTQSRLHSEAKSLTSPLSNHVPADTKPPKAKSRQPSRPERAAKRSKPATDRKSKSA